MGVKKLSFYLARAGLATKRGPPSNKTTIARAMTTQQHKGTEPLTQLRFEMPEIVPLNVKTPEGKWLAIVDDGRGSASVAELLKYSFPPSLSLGEMYGLAATVEVLAADTVLHMIQELKAAGYKLPSRSDEE